MYEPDSPRAGMPDAPPATVGAGKREKRQKPIEREFVPLLRVWDGGRLIVSIPVETRSESNLRDWRARSRRSGSAWRAVRSAFDVGDLKVFQDRVRNDNGAVDIVFTRLGGRKLDRGNLPHSLKGCEDAVAYLLGVDDGSNHWSVRYEQEPGGPIGVRVEIN